MSLETFRAEFSELKSRFAGLKLSGVAIRTNGEVDIYSASCSVDTDVVDCMFVAPDVYKVSKVNRLLAALPLANFDYRGAFVITAIIEHNNSRVDRWQFEYRRRTHVAKDAICSVTERTFDAFVNTFSNIRQLISQQRFGRQECQSAVGYSSTQDELDKI